MISFCLIKPDEIIKMITKMEAVSISFSIFNFCRPHPDFWHDSCKIMGIAMKLPSANLCHRQRKNRVVSLLISRESHTEGELSMRIRVLFVLLGIPAILTAQPFPYQNTSLPAEDRVKDLVGRLTLDEKLDLLGGTGFASKPVVRLGIPEIKMTDGPIGVRWEQATAFPSGISLASTWDTVLAHSLGNALALETLAKGRDMLLGPAINIHRAPHGGRNFEYLGEDPFLTSRLAVNWVKGLQEKGVISSTKHFAVNSHEHERMTINVKVSERAMREIYWPAFEAAVKEADTWTIMASYNRLNGPYATANHHLLTEVLKKDWGFRGFVVSDWGAVHGDLDVALAGTDLEMPFGAFLNAKNLKPYIESGKLPLSVIDDKITRLIRVMMLSGLFDRKPGSLPSALNTPEHQALARKAATESIVLLKNSGSLLPLNLSKLKSVAVLGPNAETARTGGGGSSQVWPVQSVSPLDAFRELESAGLKVTYFPGASIPGDVKPIPASAFRNLKSEFYNGRNLDGPSVLTRDEKEINFEWGDQIPAAGLPADNYSMRLTGELIPDQTGTYRIDGLSDDGIRVWVDGKLLIDNWSDHGAETRSAEVSLQKGTPVPVKVEFYENGGTAVLKLGWNPPGVNLLDDAVRAAKNADAAVLFVGSSNSIESEGFDRKELSLPQDHIRLIQEVARVNKNTVVVFNSGAAVLMEGWLDLVPAVLATWFPGQDAGHPVTDILFGKVSPSGKLATSFPKRWEDSQAYGNFPGDKEINYEEGILVGYRWFDTKKIEPLFPFGFGLSYTTFDYSGLKIERTGSGFYTVSVTVKNTGKVHAAEVVQVYVSQDQPPVLRPEKELKGFSRVDLAPGDSKTVTIKLNPRSFSWYDETSGGWMMNAGAYQIRVGSSSKDIKLTEKVML